MRHALRHLSGQNFRNFAGTFEMPLDADVVLMFGPNGAGKSNLLAAIEFVITGGVRDFASFGNDYPRCLRNLSAAAPAEVSVSLTLAESAAKVTRRLTADDEIAETPPSEILSSFRERCYLSQRQLASFCERLSAIDPETGKPAIVSSLRSILGLDLVERLQNGLYDVEDRRRLRKASKTVRELDAALDRLQDAVAVNTARSKELQERVRDLQTRLNERLEILGEQLLHQVETTDWEQLLKRFAPIRNAAVHRGTVPSGARLRLQEERLAAIELRLSRNEAQRSEVAALRARLTELDATISRLTDELERFGSRASRELGLLKESLPVSITGDVIESVRYWTERLPSVLQEGESRLIQSQARDKRIVELAALTAANEKSLAQRIAARESEPKLITELAAALAELSKHISGDICPVCERDFSEASSISLIEHVQAKITALQAGLSREREEDAQFSAFRARVEADRELLAALKAQAADEAPALRGLGESLMSLRTLMKSTDSLAPARHTVLSARTEREELRKRLASLREVEQEETRLQSDIRQIATESNIALPSRLARDSIEILRTTLASRIDVLQQDAVASAERGREAIEVTLLVENALAICREIDALRKKAADLEKKQTMLTSVSDRLGNSISVAKDIVKTARRAEMDVLQDVFDRRLNVFIGDLFSRLVPDEPFRPALADLALNRGKALMTGMAARVGDEEVFQHLAAALNVGNLNTAALVIFLSLHLIEAAGPQLLVLDDPIQNMDDVHVTQLAALFRELVRTRERQMVIAVHERALFEYLQLELGPTRDGDSMLAIELARDKPITFHRKEFSRGKVAFGA